MSVRLLMGAVLAGALIYFAASSAGRGPGFSADSLLIGTAQAQSAQQIPSKKPARRWKT